MNNNIIKFYEDLLAHSTVRGGRKMGIQEYLNDLLNFELREIKYRYREKIVDDIKNRMCSLLSRWEQIDFRKTVLFVTDIV